MSNIKYPIVLFGKTGSGKTSVAKEMEKMGIKRLISYTTRPKRSDEKDGVDYHFISEQQFFEMVDHGRLAEITSRTESGATWYYGTAVENYGSTEPSVCVMDLNGLRTLRVMGIPHTAVLLNVSNEYAIARCHRRGDNMDEATKRLKLERMTFASAPALADYIIDANHPFFIVMQEIAEIVKEDLTVWKHVVWTSDCTQGCKTNFLRLYGTNSDYAPTSADEVAAYVHKLTGEVIYVHPRAQYDPNMKRNIESLQSNIAKDHPFSYEWLERFCVQQLSTCSVSELRKIGLNDEQIRYIRTRA